MRNFQSVRTSWERTLLISNYRDTSDHCAVFDLWNEDGTRMKMSGSNGGEVMAVMSGDLSEESDEEEDPSSEYLSKWLADYGDLYHLENEPFTGYFHDNC